MLTYPRPHIYHFGDPHPNPILPVEDSPFCPDQKCIILAKLTRKADLVQQQHWQANLLLGNT